MENGHSFLRNENAEMSLTIHGYRIAKTDVKNVLSLKGILTVKPYIPSVFVRPQFVTKYAVYRETEEYFYVPKHYGIETFGPVNTSFREVPKTDASFWEFNGQIRDAQLPVVLCKQAEVRRYVHSTSHLNSNSLLLCWSTPGF